MASLLRSAGAKAMPPCFESTKGRRARVSQRVTQARARYRAFETLLARGHARCGFDLADRAGPGGSEARPRAHSTRQVRGYGLQPPEMRKSRLEQTRALLEAMSPREMSPASVRLDERIVLEVA